MLHLISNHFPEVKLKQNQNPSSPTARNPSVGMVSNLQDRRNQPAMEATTMLSGRDGHQDALGSSA